MNLVLQDLQVHWLLSNDRLSSTMYNNSLECFQECILASSPTHRFGFANTFVLTPRVNFLTTRNQSGRNGRHGQGDVVNPRDVFREHVQADLESIDLCS